jgi:hypothetical protein
MRPGMLGNESSVLSPVIIDTLTIRSGDFLRTWQTGSGMNLAVAVSNAISHRGTSFLPEFRILVRDPEVCTP